MLQDENKVVFVNEKKVMSEEKQQYVDSKCHHEFIQCDSAQKIKLILDKYNKIVFDKNHKKKHKSDAELKNSIHKLMNNISSNGQYSNVELLNDFYHIKYNHNVDSNPKKFNEFYKYLFDNDTA
eukprot:32045_1